jgi:uncharacterized protein
VTGLLGDLTSFGARLREEGVLVDAGRMAAFAEGLAELGYPEAYWVGRTTLVASADDLPAFDRAFAAHFGDQAVETPATEDEGEDEQMVAASPSPSIVPVASGEETETVGAVAGATERLRGKRFDTCTPEELAAVESLLRDLIEGLAIRRTRRHRRHRHGRLDPHRTIRRVLREGDPHRLDRRRRLHRRRPMVVLIDVSGSMFTFTRPLIAFAHAAAATHANCETFCFGTHLTRITDALRTNGVDAALATTSEEVTDWDGGTRIGEALKSLLDAWGRTAMLRGSVVVICSDGLETGDPALLAGQMARLKRTSHRIIWLNPVKGVEGYLPLARGMSAALPFVDRFAAGDTLSSLAAIAEAVTEMTGRGSQ